MRASLFIIAILTFPLISNAQRLESPFTKNIEAEFSTGLVGGSYYDVPKKYDIDKYGEERLSPKGISLKGIIDTDKYGNLVFKLSKIKEAESAQSLSQQTQIRYSSPKIDLGQKKDFSFFLQGSMAHYSQKDRLVYFRIDNNLAEDIQATASLEDGLRYDHSQNYLSPQAGVCYTKGAQLNDFDISGFAQASLAPVALLNYNSGVSNEEQDTHSSLYDTKRTVAAHGGFFSLGVLVKYKGRYYLKVSLDQDYLTSLYGDLAGISNRSINGSLDYELTPGLKAGLRVENSEMVLFNQNRRGIDVLNTFGVGVNVNLDKLKRKK